MEQFLTRAEELYKDERYEEALAVYEEALHLGGDNPDPRLYFGRALVLERLAQQAYEMAKQSEYNEEPPSNMSLAVLEDRCNQEVNKSRRGEPSNDQYCLEIFHRAMVQHDDPAWDLISRSFSPVVRDWLRNHPMRDNAMRFESEENYVAETFRRFWRATEHSAELEFRTLASALHYLRASLNGAIMDTLRANLQQKEASLPEPSGPYPKEPTAEDDGIELWESIQSLLPDGRESRLGFLLFYAGLKPREIVRYYSQEFSDVKEVYRLRRNILERLSRNRDQLRWRLS